MKPINAEVKAEHYPIRELFLREFFHRLIVYGYESQIASEKLKRELNKINPKNVPVQKEEKAKLFELNEPKNIVAIPIQKDAKRFAVNQVQSQKQFIPTKQTQNKYIQRIMRPVPNPPPKQIAPSKNMAKDKYIPSISTAQEDSALSKVLPFLNDESVANIECSGPNKPILINKYGSVQTSRLILTEDDIKAILQEISNKTKIPLISGTFKALFDNYLCTAVISDFVGSRFIIQRKPLPQMPPMSPPQR